MKSYSYLYYDLYPDIRQVTENQKIEFSGDLTTTERWYDLDSSVVTVRSRGYYADAFYARKLSNHFSAGVKSGYSTSDYNNIRLGLGLAPKFEYDLVSYSEYVRHKIYIQDSPYLSYLAYFDTTLYDRMGETRLSNILELGVKMTRPWGTIDLSVTGSHYLHDFSKNRLSLYISTSFRVVAGLSVEVSGGYDFIHDQLSLRKEGATEEERLLRLREMETGYSYWTSLSLTYTFGSIFSNIVNPIF